jgi:hypothetical protein
LIRPITSIVDWASKEAHEAFTKLDDYPNMVDACRPVMASQPTTNFVKFEDTKRILGAPITEFVTFALKEGKTVTDLEPLVKELHQKLAGAPKFHGDSWSVVIDKPNVYHGILGWDTVEVSDAQSLTLVSPDCVDPTRHTGMPSMTVLARR